MNMKDNFGLLSLSLSPLSTAAFTAPQKRGRRPRLEAISATGNAIKEEGEGRGYYMGAFPSSQCGCHR